MAGKQEHIVYLSIGSNVSNVFGDREAQVEMAIEAIGRLPGTRMLRRSPMYETKPWGYVDQPDFLNLVLEISTTLPPHTLLRHLKHIEKEQGRQESDIRWGPRPIDLDILLYGNRQLRTASLTVPHPRMWERLFVLRPLADLRPDLRAPDGTSIADLLKQERIATQGIKPYDQSLDDL